MQQPKAKKLGNYELVRTLGEGTFGKVKLAVHLPTEQLVAIKILDKEKIVEVADVERVSREIHILKIIRHPNLIQLYEIIESSKQLFLVMEFAEGGELFDFIVKHKRLEEAQACRIFQQLIYGVEYLHGLRIVHRDLKPENLLLDHQGRVKIVDFGLSNTFKEDELVKTGCGSPCYAAPEMIEGAKYFGPKVDVWSCGVILYAMLCGCLPFEDTNTTKLYEKIIAGHFSLPTHLSAEARDLIRRMLTVDPEKRISSGDVVRHGWFRLVQSQRVDGIMVGYNRIPSDKEVLARMAALGLDTDFAKKCLEANRQNDATTTYYLLLKKMLKAGHRSRADLNNPDFDRTLIQPIQRRQRPERPAEACLPRARVGSTGESFDQLLDSKPDLKRNTRYHSVDREMNEAGRRGRLDRPRIVSSLDRRSKKPEVELRKGSAQRNQERSRNAQQRVRASSRAERLQSAIPSVQTKKLCRPRNRVDLQKF